MLRKQSIFFVNDIYRSNDFDSNINQSEVCNLNSGLQFDGVLWRYVGRVSGLIRYFTHPMILFARHNHVKRGGIFSRHSVIIMLILSDSNNM